MQCDVWWSLDWGKQGLNPTPHCNTSIYDKSAKCKRKNSWVYRHKQKSAKCKRKNSWVYINSKKQPNRKKNVSNSSLRLSFLCSSSMCSLQPDLHLKHLPQRWHPNGRLSMWDFMCSFKYLTLENILSHILHLISCDSADFCLCL